MLIGIFDSGFGGLSILKKITATLPAYEYVYLGDNARAPYGDRSPEVIYEYTRQGVDFLFKHNCALVILACNTASAHALRRLQQELLPAAYPDRRILGIIIPTVERCVALDEGTTLGIIGTRATIESNVFEREIEKRLRKKFKLFPLACPLLVPLIEEGWHETVPGTMIIKKYLRPLKMKKISVLILACTHYAVLEKRIKRIMGKQVRVIEQGGIVASALKRYLADHPELEARLTKGQLCIWYTTETSARFTEKASRLWGAPLKATHATLERL